MRLPPHPRPLPGGEGVPIGSGRVRGRLVLSPLTARPHRWGRPTAHSRCRGRANRSAGFAFQPCGISSGARTGSRRPQPRRDGKAATPNRGCCATSPESEFKSFQEPRRKAEQASTADLRHSGPRFFPSKSRRPRIEAVKKYVVTSHIAMISSPCAPRSVRRQGWATSRGCK
jgi:hypothetical protein